MGDGYYTKGIIMICTDNFSQQEVLKLIKVLNKKFGEKSGLNKRTNTNKKIV